MKSSVTLIFLGFFLLSQARARFMPIDTDIKVCISMLMPHHVCPLNNILSRIYAVLDRAFWASRRHASPQEVIPKTPNFGTGTGISSANVFTYILSSSYNAPCPFLKCTLHLSMSRKKVFEMMTANKQFIIINLNNKYALKYLLLLYYIMYLLESITQYTC